MCLPCSLHEVLHVKKSCTLPGSPLPLSNTQVTVMAAPVVMQGLGWQSEDVSQDPCPSNNNAQKLVANKVSCSCFGKPASNSCAAEPAGVAVQRDTRLVLLSIVKHGMNLSHVSFMSTIASAKLSGV